MTIDAHDVHRHRVLEATEHLPFEQVEALWLVDVCCYDYYSAARSTGSSTPEFTRRLHSARTSIRHRINGPPHW